MPLSELTSRDAVLRAIQKFDAIGQLAFLRRYGFGEAGSYLLDHEGRTFDSKAIVGAAYGFQYPTRGPLTASGFSGGASTVAPVLRALGLEVRTALSEDTVADVQRWALAARPSRYRVRDAVANGEVDQWLSRGKSFKPRDTVMVWQTQDAEGFRGVVALGDVLSTPMPMRSLANPYWVNAGDGADDEAPRRQVFALPPFGWLIRLRFV